ncbi:retrovirus-related pol polyprotein from transposon TNT 1-94 [Tanacetum coccineum]
MVTPRLEDGETRGNTSQENERVKGAKYRTEVCADRRLSISEEALGAFGKSQTYRVEGTTKGMKQNKNKSKSYKIGEIKYRQNITCWNCNQKGHFQNQCSKLVASRDKEVNIAARDSNDALVCCVKNTVEDRIRDSSASFHATYCKEELERFKLRSGKVRLADDKTLDIASVGDVVLKLLLLDEEGYHVSFGDQHWKVTKGSLVVAHRNKCESLYMVEVHPEGIDAIIDGSGSATLWFGEAEEAFLHNVREDKETAEVGATGVAIGIVMLKMVPETPLQFGVAERLSRTFRAESTRLCTEARQIQSATDSSSLTKPIHKSQVVLVDIPENLAENDSIVAEHGLSSKITQSAGGSSNTSEGSENSGSFQDSRRSDEEYSEDGSSSNEGGSKTPCVRRSTRESRALVSKESVQWKKAINKEMVSLEKNQTCSLVRLPAGKKASQSLWMFRVKEEQDGRKRYKAKLVVKGFQQKRRVDYNEIFSPVMKMTTIRLVLSIVAAGAFLCRSLE